MRLVPRLSGPGRNCRKVRRDEWGDLPPRRHKTPPAAITGLSKRTIDFHLDNARIKLAAATRTEAALKAAIGRLIQP